MHLYFVLPPRAGREPTASPLGVGSGALSPTSGILSPATTTHDKRIPLHQLFENLQDLAAIRTDLPVLEPVAAMAAAAAAAAGPEGRVMSMPPLPHPAGSRLLPPSSSNPTLENGGAAGSAAEHASALLRPRSEASLSSMPMSRVSPFTVPVIAHGSAPSAGGCLAAAVQQAEAAPAASPTSGSSNVSPRSIASQAPADAIQRLDLQSTAPLPPAAPSPAILARASAPHVLSAPPSKVSSRDISPAREGSLSPTRPASQPGVLVRSGEGGSADLMGQLNGKRPPIKGE